ncbi:hypothetical protein Tco_0813533 [Tanacetum coccineum]
MLPKTNRKCTKHFPKPFTQRSSVDSEGYPVYRRRDNGNHVDKTGHKLHNGYDIPYNAMLLKRYQCHINVEWCNLTGSIKYLFKYINKGPDRVSAKLYETVTTTDGQQIENPDDEIKAFYDYRYLSACEAAWRIFGYEIYYRTPSVKRLSFHLGVSNKLYTTGTQNLKPLLTSQQLVPLCLQNGWKRINYVYITT